MSKSSVKKLLASMDKAQIIEVVMELYDAQKEAKEYLEYFACPSPADSFTRSFTLQQPKAQLSLEQKVKLFRSLFVGREDVFARRWFSKAMNKGGYQPVCLNEWRAGVCDKKKTKCADCPNRQLKALEYEDFYRHLAGKDECGRDVVGLYPIREDGTCRLLCADFDDKSCEHGYKEDVLAYVSVAKDWGINAYIERSRSGNGAHVWIFFEEPVEAAKARRLGNALITVAMNRRGQMSLKSYDRLFPNQDSITDGGFGNLVALPLQGQARRNGNSVFVDEGFHSIDDQWGYLLNIKRLTSSALDEILHRNSTQTELGQLSTTSEKKPWETPEPESITPSDFTAPLKIIRANQLYIPQRSVSAKVVNHLKRVAAFRNPDFYAKRAMHFSTHNVPRIISCSTITDDYIGLPRGCEDAVLSLLKEQNVRFLLEDKTNEGQPVSVNFKGTLRPEQTTAVKELLRHNNGILHATTAFGKTVAAIGLIAERKVNTLILVHTKALLDQWRERLETFLEIDFTEDDIPKKRGRKRKFSPFGTLDSSGNSLHGQVDIALIQSCLDDSETGVKDFVRDYGMVIVDECHHIPAAGFEQVLRHANARFVYGLTATPIRKDGHQPIIFMQCGPIRFAADSQQQIATQTFDRILIPRFTSFRLLTDEKISFTMLAERLAEDELRNELIAADIEKSVAEGRTPLVLTTRTEHVRLLSEILQRRMPHVTIIQLVGSEKAKEKREKMALLANLPTGQPLVIIATGKYVGEGFDYPRLDTLMLASPVSWKGLVQQYAGRLHREHNGKRDVRIYDYIDLHVPLAELMYRRRMKGYAAIGYKLISHGEEPQNSVVQSIFDSDNYFQHYLNDLKSLATKSIVISSPKIWLPKFAPLLELLQEKQSHGTEILILTRHENDHTKRLQASGLPVRTSPSATLSCAILNRRLTWYGSLNFLAHAHSEDYVIRINDAQLAEELIGMIL